MATRRRTSPVSDLALVAVFAGLIAAFTLAPAVPVGPLGVPITLQTLAVALTAMVLGPWRGAAADALYVVVGLAGLPILAGGGAGIGTLARPSAGYLLSFPVAALVIGLLARVVVARTRSRGGLRFVLLVLAGLAGSIVAVHPLGIVGMSVNGHIPMDKAFLADMAYWPGDVVKNIVAAAVALAVHRAFPTLMAPPAASEPTRQPGASVAA